MTLKFISSLHWSHFAVIQPGKHGPCQEAPALLSAASPTCTKDSWRLRIHLKFCDVTTKIDKFYKGKGLKADERHHKMFCQKYSVHQTSLQYAVIIDFWAWSRNSDNTWTITVFKLPLLTHLYSSHRSIML